MIKRFFTKKSVALILATIVLVGFSTFGFANAQTTARPDAPTFEYDKQIYTYQGSGKWSYLDSSPGDPTNGIQASNNEIVLPPSGLKALPADKQSAAEAYDKLITDFNKTNQSSIDEWIGKWTGKGIAFLAKGLADTISSGISIIVQVFMIPIASLFLAIAGSILDFAIQYTIYGQGFTNEDMQNAIQIVWVLIRDIANICFIFILLYEAIKQITTGINAKKILVPIIISAVLINFSLFLTRIAVDASNLVSVAIYNQIDSTGQTSGNAVKNLLSGFGSGLVGGGPTVDLSGRIMDSVGLTTMFDTKGSGSDSLSVGTVFGTGALLLAVLKLATFWVTTFVFFALALLLVGRFITIFILMATSPLGMIDAALPGIGQYSSDWRKELTNQCLMAPLLMFFMLLTIKVALITQKMTAATANPMIVLFNFFIVVFLLLKSVKVAKSKSGAMGDVLGKYASQLTGIAVGAATGGTAFVARQTLGAGANAIANSGLGKNIQARIDEGRFGSSVLDKVYGGTIKNAAKGTFDIRNTGIMRDSLGQAKSLSGMELISGDFAKASGIYGKGTGYAGLVEKRTQEALETAKNADKATGSYQQKIVDENPVMMERYQTKKQEELNKLEEQKKVIETEKKKLETERGNLQQELQNAEKAGDANKQKEIKEKIKENRDNANETKNKSTENESSIKEVKKSKEEAKAADVLKSHNEDFTAAEAKIATYKKQQEDLQKTQTELESKMAKATGDELDSLKAEQTKLEKEILETEKNYKQMQEVQKIGGLTSELETIKRLKTVRKTMAESYRHTLAEFRIPVIGKVTVGTKLNTLGGRNVEIASKILRDTKEKEKTISDVLKEQKKLEEKIEKQNK